MKDHRWNNFKHTQNTKNSRDVLYKNNGVQIYFQFDTKGSLKTHMYNILKQHYSITTTTVHCKAWRSHLPKVQGNIHLIVDQSPGKGRTLPPPFCPIDGVGHRVGFVWINGVAVVTELTLIDVKFSHSETLTLKIILAIFMVVLNRHKHW